MKDRKDKIVILLITISVFLFLFLTKTVISGYHFVDDHEVVKIKSELRSTSLIDVTTKWVKEDMFGNARFRPAYYVHRVLETKLFGSDFLLWSLYNGVLCCLALIFSYIGTRNLKFTIGESIAFLIIAFVGPQSSVWWRLGPVESLSMVFLSLSYYFLSRTQHRRKYLINNLLFILFLILASLTKESFLIVIQAMILFKIWNDKNCIWYSLKESIVKNLILIVPLLVMFIELYIIKFYIGTEYSRLEANFFDNIPSILSTTVRFIKTYLNLVIAGILVIIVGLYYKKRPGKLDILPVVFFLMIIVPNIILYAKSGLEERYLLPASFGLGIFVVSIIKSIGESEVLQKKIALTLVLVSFLPYSVNSVTDALDFSREGLATKKLLSAISANNLRDAQVLLIADPVDSYEISVSLKNYLYFENKIELYGYDLLKNEKKESEMGYIDGWRSYFDGRLYSNMTSKPGLLVFLDNQIIESFFKTSKLIQNDYLPIDIGDSPYALFKNSKY